MVRVCYGFVHLVFDFADLKRSYSDGTSHLLFTPIELVEKMAALVPQPRVHLTRYFGCLAPHAKIRSLIVPQTHKPEVPVTLDAATMDTPKTRRKKLSWAQLLARVFSIDVSCPNCFTELKPIAAIIEVKAITKILDHLGLPSKPPDIHPARLSAAIEFCQAL